MATLRKAAETFKIERRARIAAASEAIFPLLNDLRLWAEWSPWDKLDPAMRRDYGGAARGVGAVYTWAGNGKAGAGRMEIIDSSPNTQLVIQLDFIRPFKARNRVVFTLEAQGAQTEVIWTMTGPKTLISKVMGLFFNMDALVGKDFETGLANLRALVEG